ncbi:LAMI_0B08768g1_1 [Lachancea mirantina]|uniref:LAMI_0B08768g1_1 n=1 Tax=Lachancea mirantina TaxID=1230905 RepID=A0A1G4IYA4_9SACH|nr:LAMI_0B08768g1_1 [Lachancea mirantina]
MFKVRGAGKDDDTGAPQLMRTKLACDTCRIKKRKCDGQKPICQRCLKDGHRSCNFSYNSDKRRPYSKNYVKQLEGHIKDLENELRKLREKSAPRSISAREAKASNVAVETRAVRRNETEGEHRESTSDYERDSSVNDSIELNSLVDGHGKFKTENGTKYFYGPRSTVSFLKGEVPLMTMTENTDLSTLDRVGNSNVTCSDHEIFLCELYFAYQNNSILFLSEKLFFEQLMLPCSLRDPTSLTDSLINAVLALGCNFNSSDTNNRRQAANYAARSRQLLQEEFEKPTIITVQSCGVLALFYISNDQDRLAWHFCAAAVSCAYSLGLNVDEKFKGAAVVSEKEAEQRRMAFWTTYLLERTLNNMVGRPTLLKTGSIICLVPSGTEMSDYEQWSNPNKNGKTSVNLYTRAFSLIGYTIELFIISAKPLDHIYLSFKPSAPSELQLIVNKADIELSQFESSSPEFLRLHFVLAPENRAQVSPGLFLFQMRYHNIRILLHRVFFLRNLEQEYADRKALFHKTICFESAMATSRLISRYGEEFGLENLDVCAADLICTAAIIFLHLRKHPQLEEWTAEGNSKVRNAQNLCSRKYSKLKLALQSMSTTNLWSTKSLSVLNRLEEEWYVDST